MLLVRGRFEEPRKSDDRQHPTKEKKSTGLDRMRGNAIAGICTGWEDRLQYLRRKVEATWEKVDRNGMSRRCLRLLSYLGVGGRAKGAIARKESQF